MIQFIISDNLCVTNCVTLQGFASYVEYLGVDAVQPDMKLLEQFVVSDLQDVFRIDALESSHPISIPVKHPDEIQEIFDRISYGKGAAIIRMMDNFLTTATFRQVNWLVIPDNRMVLDNSFVKLPIILLKENL